MAKNSLEATTFDESVEVSAPKELSFQPKIHNLIRYISRKGWDVVDGERSVWTVDAEVSAWIEQGYKLFNTHYLGENPEGYGMLYVLVRE